MKGVINGDACLFTLIGRNLAPEMFEIYFISKHLHVFRYNDRDCVYSVLNVCETSFIITLVSFLRFPRSEVRPFCYSILVRR